MESKLLKSKQNMKQNMKQNKKNKKLWKSVSATE